MLGQFVAAGAELTNNQDAAQVIIINTCGFIADAIDESSQAIAKAASHKSKGNLKALIITGCYAQRNSSEILDNYDVDAVVGIGEYGRISEIISEALQNEVLQIPNFEKANFDEELFANRIRSTPKYMAYVKIAEGCDNHCTYCTIPQIRGAYRSRSRESILKEVESLAESGTKEIIIIAQDTALYGLDNYGEQILHELLADISKIPGIHWIRLLYCYPEHIRQELIDEMANNPKILKYLDMPIQHSSDKILDLMGRKSNRAGLIEIIGKLRAAMPDIILRTTLITGFPQESREDFIDICKFIQEMQFDRLGVFAYSQEKGTPAADMIGQIDDKKKENRKNRLMLMQQEISQHKLAAKIGQILEVLIEGKTDVGYHGRSYADAPEIDGMVYISYMKKPELEIGSFVKICITDSDEYDLYAE